VIEIHIAECQRHCKKKEEEGGQNEIQFLHVNFIYSGAKIAKPLL